MSNIQVKEPHHYHCPFCDWHDETSEMGSISNAKNLEERIAAGEFVPAGVCPECGALISVANETVPDDTLDIAAMIMRERGWIVFKPEPAIDTKIQFSIDGGITYYGANSGVRIIYKGIEVPDSSDRNELHINATEEGLISDIWSVSDYDAPGVDHNLATERVAIDDCIHRMLDQSTSSVELATDNSKNVADISAMQLAVEVIEELRYRLHTIVNDGVNTDGEADILYYFDIEQGRELLSRTSNFKDLLGVATEDRKNTQETDELQAQASNTNLDEDAATSNFDPGKSFDSPTEAIDLIQQQPDQIEALLAVVRANVQHSEFGFASEVIREFGSV